MDGEEWYTRNLANVHMLATRKGEKMTVSMVNGTDVRIEDASIVQPNIVGSNRVFQAMEADAGGQ